MKNITKQILIGLLIAFASVSTYAQRTEIEEFMFENGVAVSNYLTLNRQPVAIEGIYPVFKLDLGEYWTDFEIKASTNNFAPENNSGGSNLVYYYRSWTTQHQINPDTNAWVYYTDDYADDPRVWIFKRPTNSIANQLADVSNSVICTVYFFPSRNQGNDCSWMRRDNTNLVWSWLRVTYGTYEKRKDGTKTRWRIVRPDSWESGRTSP